jgi:hypothetical protein
MKRKSRSVLTLLLALLPYLVAATWGAERLAPLKPYKTEIAPVIDGVLDDEVWKHAPSESVFKTYSPDYGKDMSQKTTVYYAYDRENLYFAYRCYDSEPAKIKASVAARDTIRRDDWICLNLDTFDDQQTLSCFYVNPLGIQMDSKFEGNQEDNTVDFVWYSAGRIGPEGYTVEVKIPFKSLRYARREPVHMGINFERYISRLSEAGTMPPLDPAQGQNFLTQTRPLEFADIRHYTLLEVLPAVTTSAKGADRAGSMAMGAAATDLSLTAKYGLTSQLILDGTINPDFSQVESDAGQVDFNLRYALYYPEKRPFFLEGREKFNLAAGQAGDPLESVVYTRSIVDPRMGFRLNGKIAPRDSISTIYAADALPAGGPSDTAHFTILRYKHALSEDGFVGGYWTSRFEGPRYNIVAGSDGQIRLNPSSFFAFHALVSQTGPGGAAADAEGHALGVEYSYLTRDLTVDIAAQDVSKDFQTEAGYLTRTGLTRLKAGAFRSIYPASSLFLRIDPIVHLIVVRDKYSGLWETTEQFDLRVLLPRATTFLAGGRYATEVFLGRRLERSNMRVQMTSQFSKRLLLTLAGAYGNKIRYVDDPYQGRGSDLMAAVTYLPSDKLNFALSYTYSNFTRSADGLREYNYTILRSLNTLQFNKYLFVRAIFEYNSFYKRLMTDFLASFTYIPGTVVFLGYGSSYEKTVWRDGAYEPSDRFQEMRRGFFFKASYLWRI